MSSAYLYPLIFKPVIITEPGQYKTRCGEVVTIHTASTRHDLGCGGHYPEGIAEWWHKSGRIFAETETNNDIISKIN